jgi:hypothetical protein
MTDTVTNLTGAFGHEAQMIRLLKEWGTGIDNIYTVDPYDALPYTIPPVSPFIFAYSGASYTVVSWQDLLTQVEADHVTAIVSDTNINNKVDNTSNETVAGIKDFTDNCTGITPVGGTDFAIKSYVDASTPADATESTKGIAELANQTESETGTDDTRVTTPLKVKQSIQSQVASTAETITGTDNTKLVSPKQLKDAFEDDYCHLRITSDQTTGSTVSWDDEISDLNGMHESITNPTRITVVNTGAYIVSVKCIREAATTFVGCVIDKNGTGTGSGHVNTTTVTAADVWESSFTNIMQLSASDYIEITYSNAFTGTYPLRQNSFSIFTEIEVQRIV